jgi:D-3-phosphoglycerate dehydrogenase
MRVVIWSREKAREAARNDGYDVATNREAMFEEADVLSMHVRLVPETRGLVKAADFARMKPTAVFVNTSRAGLVEDGALVAALRAGPPGFAAVDVYQDEPVFDARDPLLALENVICTPHLGYVERDQLENYFSDQFERVLAFAAGKPYGVVNPAALSSQGR